MRLVYHLLRLLFLMQAAMALQYYIDQPDLLIDISLSENVSSNSVDFHISMASQFGPNGGWVALGTGNIMAGSLMFIIYPNENNCNISHVTVLDLGLTETDVF